MVVVVIPSGDSAIVARPEGRHPTLLLVSVLAFENFDAGGVAGVNGLMGREAEDQHKRRHKARQRKAGGIR